ncbi:MAG: endonuclease/exonuclease/phosphatase family protein [Pirellulales bacterium]
MKLLPGCLAWALLLGSLPVNAGELVIAGYNIENLFDTKDDPAKEDFLPADWTEEMLSAKLKNLATVIRGMKGGQGPDVLGVCEVENREMLDALVAAIGLPEREYKIVHQDSPDERGIDCAIIYDAKVFQLAGHKFLPVTVQATRDIVEAQLKTGNEVLYVFMNHWPSKNNPEADRVAAAEVLRKRIDEIQAQSPLADIICVGDFNDFVDEPALHDTLRTTGTKSQATGGALYNSAFAISQPPTRGSYVFRNAWELIDHIVVSQGLLSGSGLKWKDGSTTELKDAFLLFDPPGDAIPKPHATRSGPQFHADGVSDHLPLVTVLTSP